MKLYFGSAPTTVTTLPILARMILTTELARLLLW